MATATIKKEVEKLKERQTKLEQAFYTIFEEKLEREEEIQPKYLKKLKKIEKNILDGNGVISIRNKQELRNFFRSL